MYKFFSLLLVHNALATIYWGLFIMQCLCSWQVMGLNCGHGYSVNHDIAVTVNLWIMILWQIVADEAEVAMLLSRYLKLLYCCCWLHLRIIAWMLNKNHYNTDTSEWNRQDTAICDTFINSFFQILTGVDMSVSCLVSVLHR